MTSGGRFDFDDGGTYCGGWEDGKAHGHGICTGPKSHGEYAGSWNHGFEVQGVYTWPSGNTYEGQWTQGKRHGLGVENKGRWSYRGEWTHGFKGRYGCRLSTSSRAKYEGCWNTGLQEGYGTETYPDGGTYQGQWIRGMRHGLGIRQSVPYGLATIIGTGGSKNFRSSQMSLRSGESGNTNCTMNQHVDIGFDGQPVGARGGFVLSTQPNHPKGSDGRISRHGKFQRRSSKGANFFRSASLTRFVKNKFHGSSVSLYSQKSHQSGVSHMNKSVKSSTSLTQRHGKSALQSSAYSDAGRGYNQSWVGSDSQWDNDTESQIISVMDNSNAAYDEEIEPNTVETYAGEWVEDRREGFGVCERSDGFKYEGEWMFNCRHGYGRTTFPDGTVEEGKYKENVLLPDRKSHKWLKVQHNKYTEKLQVKIISAQRVAENCQGKALTAIERTATAIQRSEAAESLASLSRDEASIARCVAKELAPDYVQPGLQYGRRGDFYDPVDRSHLNTDNLMFLSNDDKLLTPDPDIDHLLHNPTDQSYNDKEKISSNAPKLVISPEGEDYTENPTLPPEIQSELAQPQRRPDEDSLSSMQKPGFTNYGYASAFGESLVPLAAKTTQIQSIAKNEGNPSTQGSTRSDDASEKKILEDERLKNLDMSSAGHGSSSEDKSKPAPSSTKEQSKPEELSLDGVEDSDAEGDDKIAQARAHLRKRRTALGDQDPSDRTDNEIDKKGNLRLTNDRETTDTVRHNRWGHGDVDWGQRILILLVILLNIGFVLLISQIV